MTAPYVQTTIEKVTINTNIMYIKSLGLILQLMSKCDDIALISVHKIGRFQKFITVHTKHINPVTSNKIIVTNHVIFNLNL